MFVKGKLITCEAFVYKFVSVVLLSWTMTSKRLLLIIDNTSHHIFLFPRFSICHASCHSSEQGSSRAC